MPRKIKEAKTAEVIINNEALEETKNAPVVPEVVEETVPDFVEEDVSETAEVAEESVEEKNTLENFLKEEAEKPPVSGKLVKIKLNKNHRCNIGKVQYSFVKGEIYSVPLNVKNVLDRGGYLSAL